MITIGIANYNATKFLDTSMQSLQRLTKNDFKVIICDNGSRKSEIKRLQKISRKYPFVKLVFRKQSAFGSIGHGEALNMIINLMDTQYGVILDSDAIFLKRGWDEVMMNHLDDKTRIVGFPIPDNPSRSTNFPSIFACMFHVDTVKNLKIDMRPKDINKDQDTGWEIRDKFIKNGYGFKIFESKNTREYKAGPFKSILCTECYYGNKIMLSHFARGSTLGAAKYFNWVKVPLVKNVLRKTYGYYDRGKWLKICGKIIDMELE